MPKKLKALGSLQIAKEEPTFVYEIVFAEAAVLGKAGIVVAGNWSVATANRGIFQRGILPPFVRTVLMDRSFWSESDRFGPGLA